MTDDLEEFGTEVSEKCIANDNELSDFPEEIEYDVTEEKPKKKEKGSLSQWAKDGSSYFPVGDTYRKLSPGMYSLGSDNHGTPRFIKKQINTDDLINFKEAGTYKVLKEIEAFWDRKEEFKKYGFLHRRGYLFYGPAGCLDKDTFIPYQVGSSEERKNHKGGTIENLFHRFHNIPRKGRGNYIRKEVKDADFFITSINEHDRIIKNKIVDVIDSGEKECFRVKTLSGKLIETTEDHRYYIGNGKYKRLKALKEGDIIYIHDNFKDKKGRTKFNRYKEKFVKYHPNGSKKTVNGCDYIRVRLCLLVYESQLNNLSLKEYINLLNTRDKSFINSLKFVSKEKTVHHKDGDHNNDNFNNLEVMSKKEHISYHTKIRQENTNLRYIAHEDTIKSIKSIGVKKVYDIQCENPYNNFVANNFVVHNSGKSSLIQLIVSAIIKRGGIVILGHEVQLLDRCLSSLRQVEPDRDIVCLFEDIDAITRHHSAEQALLSFLDGEVQIDKVLNIATTNYPEKLDKRIVSRPRRFDRLIKIAMPNDETRREYFKKKLKIEQKELEKWVEETKDFSFAAMSDLVISVKCLGNSFEESVEKLKELARGKATSDEYYGNKTGFGD